VIDAPSQVSLNSEGKASVQVVAYVQPTDLTKLPPGRNSLDVDLIFKGSGGPGCSGWPVESVNTQKTGYKFFILNYSLSTTGTCSGTFQFYGDSVFEKANYPTFTFNVLPYVDVKSISISEVSLYSQSVSPGGIATIYYLIRNAGSKPTAGLGAGIGEFGVEPGPFGEEYSSIGWTLGLVKGDSSIGYYKSNISIPLTAKPGVYKTWVFWKGVTGPIPGPDLTILGAQSNQIDSLKFNAWVQEAQAAFSDLVIKAVYAKFGDGGGYQYIRTRPEPPAEYFANPVEQYFGLYKATLSAWADYEISNLRIENYTKPEVPSSPAYDLQKFCKIQALDTQKSLATSMSQLTSIKLRIEKFQSLDQKNRQSEYSAIKLDLESIAVTLKMWREKLSVYQSRDKDCSDFSNLLELTNSLIPKVDDHLANLNMLFIGNSPTPTTSPSPTPTTSPSPTPTTSPSPTPTTTSRPTPPTVEDDGAEEDFYATLSVSKRSDGKYRLAILSNVVEDQLIITATKKGAKSIVYKVQTSEFGGISILTTRNLAGFLLTLRFEGEKLASTKAK
jgi:hypothetical protein